MRRALQAAAEWLLSELDVTPAELFDGLAISALMFGSFFLWYILTGGDSMGAP